MTAVYSILYYGDDSLWEPALAHHRTAYVLTVWCDIDMPWLADPGHRDGPDWRRRGHLMIADCSSSAGNWRPCRLRARWSAGWRRPSPLWGATDHGKTGATCVRIAP